MACLPDLTLRRYEGVELRQFVCQRLSARAANNLFGIENGARVLQMAHGFGIEIDIQSFFL